ERTAGLAQPASDALLGIDVDDPVFVLDDRPRSWTGAKTAGARAVHALILAHQPRQVAVDFQLVDFDQIPVVGVERLEGLVAADLLGMHHLEIIPLLASPLASFAADASRGNDVLGDVGKVAAASGFSVQRRGGLPNFEIVSGHGVSPHAFSRRTRNVLYSGVQVFGSIANAVSMFASGPTCAGSPAKPQ